MPNYVMPLVWWHYVFLNFVFEFKLRQTLFSFGLFLLLLLSCCCWFLFSVVFLREAVCFFFRVLHSLPLTVFFLWRNLTIVVDVVVFLYLYLAHIFTEMIISLEQMYYCFIYFRQKTVEQYEIICFFFSQLKLREKKNVFFSSMELFLI